MIKNNIGVEAIGIALPTCLMHVDELAILRNTDSHKYTEGLGCAYIGLCKEKEDVVNLAVKAAERAFEHWQGDRSHIQLIAVGSESGLDISRPLSAWVADKLNLKGAIRSYEVKHACYGGTVALRQAYEWKRSEVSRPDSAALVIAADICRYAPYHPAEATQGAGAVAFIVRQGDIFSIAPEFYPYSIPIFDFWRPVGHDFPIVEGKISLEGYMFAVEKTFEQYLSDKSLFEKINELKYMCFHTPFPKMVLKAFTHLGFLHHLSESEIKTIIDKKIRPIMEWNLYTGNCYTASLWISVAKALCDTQETEVISAFSYGSGFGSELLILEKGPFSASYIEDYVKQDIQNAERISAQEYAEMQKATPHRRGLLPKEL